MITFLVPTIWRTSLAKTLASIECWPGDEILVVADVATNTHMQQFVRDKARCIHCPPGHDWGHTERNLATPYAKGQYVAHIDDDDYYVPGTRALMADAIEKTPNRPVLFRMQFPNGIILWQEQVIRCGNVGTPMMLIPNSPTMMGSWGSFVGGDYHFLASSKWNIEDYVWRSEIVVQLGHN